MSNAYPSVFKVAVLGMVDEEPIYGHENAGTKLLMIMTATVTVQYQLSILLPSFTDEELRAEMWNCLPVITHLERGRAEHPNAG